MTMRLNSTTFTRVQHILSFPKTMVISERRTGHVTVSAVIKCRVVVWVFRQGVGCWSEWLPLPHYGGRGGKFSNYLSGGLFLGRSLSLPPIALGGSRACVIIILFILNIKFCGLWG
nr:MAG TPA: hypothetical protein [Caudoviricetes sp.]